MNTLTKDWKNGTDIGLLIIRLLFGILLIYGHGFGKVATILGGDEIQFMDPIGIGATLSFYLAALAESICALLIILGLYTRIASIILLINFAVIFIFHAFMVGDGFSILELRYFYLFTILALFFSGPGKYSLDHKLMKSRSSAV